MKWGDSPKACTEYGSEAVPENSKYTNSNYLLGRLISSNITCMLNDCMALAAITGLFGPRII